MRPRDAHDEQILKRRRKKRFHNRYFWFVSPEDLIVQKIKVGRPLDFEDATTVLEKCGPLLDRRHLERWASRLGLSAELDYILRA
jgi:hypothetical protein